MDDVISLAHGAGGEKYRALVGEVFLPAFKNEYLEPLGDAAVLPGADFIAMTTDCFVVRPLFFPGGDIGSLAVSGTVNDLAVSGAAPRYLSVGMVIEAGFPTETLRRIAASIAQTAERAGVRIVTGDTKVIENRGLSDGITINTAGVGVFLPGRIIPPQKIEAGDKIIVSGCIAAHGMAVMNERNRLGFSPPIESDAKPLAGMIECVLSDESCIVHAMRDATRGGVAAVLNEWVTPESDIVLFGGAIPVRKDVSAACALLGLDPLYIANEGVAVFSVPSDCAGKVLSRLKNTPEGKDAVIAGEVRAGRGAVFEETAVGSLRIVIMPRGELLPRIC